MEALKALGYDSKLFGLHSLVNSPSGPVSDRLLKLHGRWKSDYAKDWYIQEYRDPLIVLPMREPSIFRGIAVSLLRPVIGSNVEIDVVALNWFAHVRKQFAAAFK